MTIRAITCLVTLFVRDGLEIGPEQLPGAIIDAVSDSDLGEDAGAVGIAVSDIKMDTQITDRAFAALNRDPQSFFENYQSLEGQPEPQQEPEGDDAFISHLKSMGFQVISIPLEQNVSPFDLRGFTTQAEAPQNRVQEILASLKANMEAESQSPKTDLVRDLIQRMQAARATTESGRAFQQGMFDRPAPKSLYQLGDTPCPCPFCTARRAEQEKQILMNVPVDTSDRLSQEQVDNFNAEVRSMQDESYAMDNVNQVYSDEPSGPFAEVESDDSLVELVRLDISGEELRMGFCAGDKEETMWLQFDTQSEPTFFSHSEVRVIQTAFDMVRDRVREAG